MKTSVVEAREHEQVVRVEDPPAGLLGLIAIHATLRGPAVGGLRMRRYAGEAEAVEDVLRLSRGMTYKNAAADQPLGGGKAVVASLREAWEAAMAGEDLFEYARTRPALAAAIQAHA